MIKEGKLPCHPYHLPTVQDIHIHHFQVKPGHVGHILLQHRAKTELFAQRQHVVSVHDDVIADQLPSVFIY